MPLSPTFSACLGGSAPPPNHRHAEWRLGAGWFSRRGSSSYFLDTRHVNIEMYKLPGCLGEIVLHCVQTPGDMGEFVSVVLFPSSVDRGIVWPGDPRKVHLKFVE